MNDCIRGSDPQQIAKWLRILVSPDSTVEMRVLYNSGAPHVRHYVATDLLTMAEDAARFSEDAKGVYWMLNPLPIDWGGSPAKDTDIARRRWLFIDCDPIRTGTVSSSATEKEAARLRMIDVDSFLADRDWPAPVIADSGNGWHLLYRIDLPGDDGGLIHRVLRALSQRFDDDAVKIDTKVGNPSRICKLYGTVAAKGESTTERPHRRSTILSIPETLEPVSTEQLNDLVNDGDKTSTQLAGPTNIPPQNGNLSRPDAIEHARKYLATMSPSISGENGHDKLLRAASVLVNDFVLTDSEALELLTSDFNPRCEPHWNEAEIRRKLHEAKKQPPNRPLKGPAGSSATNSSTLIEDETTNLIDELWPAPIDDAAYWGVTGDIVRKIAPHTEADPVAILIQLLAVVGNVIGRNAYFRVEASRHYANLFVVIVGASSVARKGTSGDHVCRIIRQADEEWFDQRTLGGLVSGEGLIWQVRDPIVKSEPVREGGRKDGKVIEYQDVITDQGIDDKRLLVFESEFSSVLKAKGRDMNTLSETLRQAWDSGRLRTAAKHQPAQSTDAHVSLVGHITAAELREVSTQTDMTNGLANRFLWCCVKRSKLLPDGGQIHREDFEQEIARIKQAIDFASVEREIGRDEVAAIEWNRLYPGLSAERPGAVGAVCNRGAAQVVRLSLLYALLDCSSVVTLDHLRAAIAVWSYCEASVKYIFGNSLSNRTADAIMTALKVAGPSGMTRSKISELFNRNKSKAELDAALQLLFSSKLARRETHPTNGRSVETWYSTA